MNAVPGMRFSLILSERDGTVKGSLRTLRDDVDVSAMAAKFSGGGHKKAAGFALPGKLKPGTPVEGGADGGGAGEGGFAPPAGSSFTSSVSPDGLISVAVARACRPCSD